jgi:hypothetical protein
MDKMTPKMSAPEAYVLLLSAILTSLLTQSNPASAAAPRVRTQAPGFYRMILGDFELTALLDGTHPFPAAEVLTTTNPDSSSGRAKLFQENLKEANDLLAASDLTAPTEGSINAFLVNTGTKLILIDSGAGSLYGSCCGHLIDNLRASGYQPEQVRFVSSRSQRGATSAAPQSLKGYRSVSGSLLRVVRGKHTDPRGL